MEKIHILHVAGELNYGGTEALLMNLLRTIDREKFQFDFVEQNLEIGAHDPEIASLGGIVYHCKHISLTGIRDYRRWWREFFYAHPEYRIIHGHSRGSAPIYMKEAHRAGRIVVAHCHNNSCGTGIRGAIRYLWQLPLRTLGDYNFACSYDSGVSQYGKHANFEVIKNGIITSKFQWNPSVRRAVREKYQLGDNDFVIGNVARFETQKNHLFLVKIFQAIHQLKPNAKLMLIGTGTLESAIRESLQQMHLLDSVIFVGNRSDVYDYYQAMDAFVLPSLFEGLGIVNIEAQVSGLPCFTSDKVVAPECKVTDLVHFIPLDHSPLLWAEEILRTVDAMGARTDHSQEVRAAGFDISETAEKLCEFYRKVLKDRG